MPRLPELRGRQPELVEIRRDAGSRLGDFADLLGRVCSILTTPSIDIGLAGRSSISCAPQPADRRWRSCFDDASLVNRFACLKTIRVAWSSFRACHDHECQDHRSGPNNPNVRSKASLLQDISWRRSQAVGRALRMALHLEAARRMSGRISNLGSAAAVIRLRRFQ